MPLQGLTVSLVLGVPSSNSLMHLCAWLRKVLQEPSPVVCGCHQFIWFRRSSVAHFFGHCVRMHWLNADNR